MKADGAAGWTYADYKAWELKPGERWEIIHGEAFAMSAPNAYHQAMLGEMYRQISNFLIGRECKAYPAPYDVRLFWEEGPDGEDVGSDNTVVQPDISVVCGREKRGPEGCCGAPDFVAEILSPSNTAIEMQRKFNLYRDAGVREYWVVDGESKSVIAYLFDGDRVTSKTYGERDAAPVASFPGLSIELSPVFEE